MNIYDRDDRLCIAIAAIWTKLTPDCEVQHTWIDDSRIVHMSVWFRFVDSYDGKHRIAPIALTLGYDADIIMNSLEIALRLTEIARHAGKPLKSHPEKDLLP